MLKIVEAEAVVEERSAGFQTLDELAREGARRMISSAMELEVAEYIERNRLERDEQGRPGGQKWSCKTEKANSWLGNLRSFCAASE